ncbi:MAG: CPBP family intramembrane metalloprotease [Spirochaetaceae bacterium]|nr:CPBP family intramembrane metalloprotease [Spirochaetaceae bacterium]
MNNLSVDDNKRIKALLSFIIIIIFWLSAGIALTLFFRSLISSISLNAINSTYYKYIEANISFFAMALGIYISLKYIMKIPLIKLISTNNFINKRYLLISFSITIFYLIIYMIIGNISGYKEISFNNIKLSERLIFLVIVLILTPFQCALEELLYRGVLLRALVGNYYDNNKIISVISSIIVGIAFTIPHLSNPELVSYMYFPLGYYFIFGFLTSFFTLHYKTVEIAIAVHVANNLFIALICNYPNSALSSKSLYLEKTAVPHYIDYLVLTIIFITIGFVLNRKIKMTKENIK